MPRSAVPKTPPSIADSYAQDQDDDFIPLPELGFNAELEAYLQVAPAPAPDDMKTLRSPFDPSPHPTSFSSMTNARRPSRSEESPGYLPTPESDFGPFSRVMDPRRLYECKGDIPVAPVNIVCMGSRLDSANAGSELNRLDMLIRGNCVRWDPWHYLCQYCGRALP